MFEAIGIVIAIIFVDCFLGCGVFFLVDENSSKIYKLDETIGIVMFWPILGVIIAIIGLIKLILQAGKRLLREAEETSDE